MASACHFTMTILPTSTLGRLRPSLLLWLCALVLVTGLPLLFYLTYVIKNMGEQHQAFVLANLERRSEAMGGDITRLVGRSVSVLSALANSDEAVTGDVRGLYDYAQRIIHVNEAYRAMTLLDEGGRMVFFTLLPFGDTMPLPGELDAHRQMLQSGKPQTLGVFPSPIAPRLVTGVAVPVFQKGRVTHGLRMIILTESLNRLLLAQHLPSDWIAVLADAQGRTLARSKDHKQFVGKLAGPMLAAAIQKGGIQHFSTVTRDGVAVRSVVRPVEGTNWFLALGVPENSLYTPVTDALHQAYGLGLAALAVSLCMAYLFSLWVTREAQAVVSSALKVRQGGPPVAVAHRIAEFARLARSLGEMHTAGERSAQALQVARQDKLTALAGRARFEDEMRHLGDSLNRAGHGSMALFFIDIDNFKQVNDSQGHDVGDQVLTRVADAMRAATREGDLLARLGGDEFCICLVGGEGLDLRAQALAQVLLAEIGKIGHGIGCSIGIALCEYPFAGLEPLLRQADQAMYEAKRQGKNRYVIHAVGGESPT